MLTQAEFKKHTVELEEICQVHGVHLMQLDRVVHINGEASPRKPSPFCPACARENIARQERDEVEKHLNASLYLKTYDVLMRDSTNKELLKKPLLVFDGFVAKTDEERGMVELVKAQAQKYLDGMVGNTLLTGRSGIGKTHLIIALAKAINEGYRAKGEPKSVLFINLPDVLREIKDSNFTKEYYYSNLMKEVDYLILDDFGVKMNTASGKVVSEWEEKFVFSVLNGRENIIVTTNLSDKEIANLYSERIASRIRNRLKGNSFKAFTITDKRYNLEELEAEAQAQLAQRNQERTKNF